MKIIIKNVKGEYIDSINLERLKFEKNILEKYRILKDKFEADIFAINETIESYDLAKFKKNIQNENFTSINLYSNVRETILTGKSLKINSTFMHKNELNRIIKIDYNDREKDHLHKGTVRSGERIYSDGNLFILGDVNPGAIVSAKKNVYVWGKLLGIAFAGEGGDKNAHIASLFLNPLQLRIGKIIAIGPKEKPKHYYPELATLENQSIVIKPYIVDSLKIQGEN